MLVEIWVVNLCGFGGEEELDFNLDLDLELELLGLVELQLQGLDESEEEEVGFEDPVLELQLAAEVRPRSECLSMLCLI